MAGQRRSGSVLSSSIFTLGLIVIVIILLFNYWLLLNRNGDVVQEAHKLRQELQHVTFSNNESLKKLDSCNAEVSTSNGKVKNLDATLKKKETLVSDISEQLQQLKKIHDSLVEQKNGLTETLARAELDKAGFVNELQLEKERCKASEKSLAKDCALACDKKVADTKKEAEQACEKQLQNQQLVTRAPVVVPVVA